MGHVLTVHYVLDTVINLFKWVFSFYYYLWGRQSCSVLLSRRGDWDLKGNLPKVKAGHSAPSGTKSCLWLHRRAKLGWKGSLTYRAQGTNFSAISSSMLFVSFWIIYRSLFLYFGQKLSVRYVAKFFCHLVICLVMLWPPKIYRNFSSLHIFLYSFWVGAFKEAISITFLASPILSFGIFYGVIFLDPYPSKSEYLSVLWDR